MKAKINFSTVTTFGIALICILGAAGCASLGNHAFTSRQGAPEDGAPVGGTQHYARSSLFRLQDPGYPRWSFVSHLGDAPGERDLWLTKQPVFPRHP